MTSLPIVILAAGAARRMGQAKQLLPYGSSTLLGAAIQTALAAELGQVLVVLGSREAEIRPHLAPFAVRIVSNPRWESGMGSSIRAGMQALPSDAEAVILLLADQPLLKVAHLQALANTYRESPASMVASLYAETVGVPALFDRKWFKTLATQSKAGGAKALLTNHPEEVAAVPFPDGKWDVDTPEDYERLGRG